MNQSTCCIHECGKPRYAKFLCQTHYGRLRATGSTERRVVKPKACRMPGCETVSRKNGWCPKHHQRIVKNGSPFDKDQSWVVLDEWVCLLCGTDVEKGSGRRRYCSDSCATLSSRGGRVISKQCGTCGSAIDLTERHESGRRKYSNVARCNNCPRAVNLSRFVEILRDRDGNDCGICNESIQMDLSYPDPMSRSVDHVLPRSLGGTEAAANLRLAHLICNIKRQNRIDYVAA